MTTLTRKSQCIWLTGAALLYLLAGIPLTSLSTMATGILGALPIVLAAGLIGWRGAFVVSLLSVPLQTLVLNLAGYPGWDAIWRHGDPYALAALFAVGVMVGLVRDLTVRKFDEAKQLESDERFSLLAENASDIIFRYHLSPTPHFAYVSPSSATISGYTPEEHYADPQLMLGIVHPDDRTRFLEQFRRPTPPGTPPAAPYDDRPFRWRRKDGSYFWGDVRATIFRDSTGEVAVVEGILRDVTARVEAETALRVSESHFRTVVETLAGGLVVQRADGTIPTCNASAE